MGTTLGVDAIAEFEILTNTYSAQYGGNGSVVNEVTRSGTNALHGSGYEFIRNSALDARNFFDPAKIPLFQKNQFGGTLGGPIKKDKMFFFANYEGIRQVTGQTNLKVIPDANALQGYIPATGAPATCNGPGAPAGYVSCGAGSNNANNFAIIKPFLNLWSPSSLGNLPIVSFPFLNQSPNNSPTTETNGTNPYNTTPYLQQWNLSIQREIMKNTVLTIAYVGSHGVHLLGQRDSNPPAPVGGLTGAGTGGFNSAAAKPCIPRSPGNSQTWCRSLSSMLLRECLLLPRMAASLARGQRQRLVVSPARTGSRLWIPPRDNRCTLTFSKPLRTPSRQIAGSIPISVF